MIASRGRSRRGAVLAAVLLAAACGTNPASPKILALSDALSGTLSVNVDRADDYGYAVELDLVELGGVGAVVDKADLTLSAAGGVIVKPFSSLISTQLTPSGKASQELVFANQPGLGLATAATAVITYVDSAGKAGSLSITKSIPACWNSYEAHCAPSHVDVGQTSACSGGIEWCSPMFFPLSGSDIQWQSMSPAVATVSKDGTLTGHSDGSSVIVASFWSRTAVTHVFSVCVGTSCKPDSLTISPQSGTLAAGATLVLQVSGFWAGQKEDLRSGVQWRSTNPAAGGFTTPGVPNAFTAVAPGTTTLTATYIGATASMAMTVK